jgi:tetratricopeptide (TPR) repeat protein
MQALRGQPKAKTDLCFIERLMMNEIDTQRFNEVYSWFEARNYLHALKGLRDLASTIANPWDKTELLYHETIFLAEMHNIPEARQRLEDLKKAVTSLIESPSDGNIYDLRIGLPVLARHAEIRVTSEERNEPEALRLIEDLISHYPKQLSLPELRNISEEITTLRGFFLANAERWVEARPILEEASPPEDWKSYHRYYLGQCYCELHEYERAREKLMEALNLRPPILWESKVHYHLGVAEYFLSDMSAAKSQFELCLKTSDQKYLDKTRIWEFLEATSRALGLQAEAENYRRMRTDLPSKSPIN